MKIFSTFFLLAAAAAALGACSEPDTGASPAPGPGRTRLTLLRDEPQAVTVYAFRLESGAFRFDTLFRSGWTPEGTLQVRLANGTYRFLFASGAGENLALQPDPLTGATWDEAAFVLRENSASEGSCLPADELFLQSPAAEAEREYTLLGQDMTISARLVRAVSQIALTLKRGYRDGEEYIEVPYAAPQTVLDAIDRIELRVDGAGRAVTPAGSSGTAQIRTAFAADGAVLSDDGFARFDGPFILPPADGTEVGLQLSVVPAVGAALQPAVLDLKGTAERNKRLEITIWITSEYPRIDVEIRTAPIRQEQDGDTGYWE